ncbi:MAG: cobyrinate a,c-diamide synthase [Fastidiosipilaceae bacterium]|jgi:cobyrinic acid a,c-diamide synthase|nr:cobyrinate a,c-diamide synthase [Clostridiaceae bacterium]
MRIPRLMIAGTGSGCGKTTLTAGILAALNNQGVDLQPFKAGPDFIDPQFHSHIVGKPSRNLDSWMMTPEMVRYLFCHNATGVDLALIEGVMGFYDGLLNEPLKGSSAELSVILKTPVILVINGKGMSLSVAAMIRGYMGLSPDVNIVGAILNQVREPIYKQLKPQVEEMTGVPLLGYLPPMPDIELKSRQLGLVTPTEIVDLDAQIAKLAAQITESVDLQLLLNLAKSAPSLDHRVPEELVSALEWGSGSPVRIGIAQDKVFNFYYQDNLDLMTQMGAELLPFSPLEDTQLPSELAGLYIGGGYPEVYAAALSENVTMLESVRTYGQTKKPLLAECGGFMYLGRTLKDQADKEYTFCNVLPVDFHMTERLSRFGYITLTAQREGILGGPGMAIRAHEFHYSDSSDNGDAFSAVRPNGRSWSAIHMTDTLFAGYPHIPFYANPVVAARAVKTCRAIQDGHPPDHIFRS